MGWFPWVMSSNDCCYGDIAHGVVARRIGASHHGVVASDIQGVILLPN